MKWIEERSENALATIHGRDFVTTLELAATKDGKITSLRANVIASMGAYLQLVTPGIPLLGAWIYAGPYAIPNYSVTFTGVFTNTTPTDAYRGAGRPEATYVLERTMDLLAKRARDRPGRAAAQELHHGVPGHARLGADDRQRRLPRLARPAARAPRPRRARGRAAGAARPRRREADRRSGSRPTTRCAASRRRGSSARSATPRAAGSRRRSAACRPARSRSSPAPRRTGRVTRRPGRRSWPTSSAAIRREVEVLHGDTSISPLRPRHLREPEPAGRWRGALVGGREDHREGARDRGAPARGLGRRPRLRGGHVHASRARPTRR